MLCFYIVVKNILSFTQFWRFYKKKTACIVNKSLSSNYFKLILIMKSLYHILALKCDFGADTSLFDEPIFRETATFLCLPPDRQRG